MLRINCIQLLFTVSQSFDLNCSMVEECLSEN